MIKIYPGVHRDEIIEILDWKKISTGMIVWIKKLYGEMNRGICVMISVIVTIYNLEPYLEKCIKSIQDQTYSDIEIVLIDDGSIDDSLEVCERFASTDKRIKVFHQDNAGIAAARILGLSKATGEYVLFIDGDDWVEKEYCLICDNYISKWNPDIILLQYRKVYDNHCQNLKNYFSSGFYDKKKLKEYIYPRMIYTGRFYEKGMDTYISGRVVRRSLLLDVAKTINKDVSFSEGALWLFSTMLKANSALITDDIVYDYRMRGDSMTIKREPPKVKQLYENLVENICETQHDIKQLLWQLDYMLLYLLIWGDIKVFYKKEVCYPFVSVPKGSRVVLYGAWRFGQRFYEHVKENNVFNIVLWVDREAEEYKKMGLDVQKPESIHNVYYDYIILCTAVYSVAESMIKTLNSLGIKDRVIKLADMPIGSDDLPYEYKKLKKDILKKHNIEEW